MTAFKRLQTKIELLELLDEFYKQAPRNPSFSDFYDWLKMTVEEQL